MCRKKKKQNIVIEVEIAPEPPPLQEPFFRRLFGAMLLSPKVYDGIAGDELAGRQAAAVVCLSALAQPSVLLEEIGAWVLPLMMGFGLLRWLLFGLVTYVVARFVVRADADYRRILRCLGFAEGPAILNFIVYSVDPPLNVWLGFLVWFWLLCAVIVAVRGACATHDWRATVIGIVSFVLYLSPALFFG